MKVFRTYGETEIGELQQGMSLLEKSTNEVLTSTTKNKKVVVSKAVSVRFFYFLIDIWLIKVVYLSETSICKLFRPNGHHSATKRKHGYTFH